MATKEQIKNTGVAFTPKELSVFLAEKIASYLPPSRQKALDPACGEGELLAAMGDVLSDSAIDFSLTGYDANEQSKFWTKKRRFNYFEKSGLFKSFAKRMKS